MYSVCEMNMARLTPLFLIVISLYGISEAQYQPITYTLVPTPPIPNIPAVCDKNKSCRLAIEELGALVQLLKEISNDSNCSARLSEDVIVRLVNALIYVTTCSCGGTGCYKEELDIIEKKLNSTGGIGGIGGVVGIGGSVSVATSAAAAGGAGGAAGVGAVAGAAASAVAAGGVGALPIDTGTEKPVS